MEDSDGRQSVSFRNAIAFLEDSASYFEARPTGGEDSAFWSNVYNAKNCREIAAMLRALSIHPDAKSAPVVGGNREEQ